MSCMICTLGYFTGEYGRLFGLMVIFNVGFMCVVTVGFMVGSMDIFCVGFVCRFIVCVMVGLLADFLRRGVVGTVLTIVRKFHGGH